ncbi:hypothetical protein [Burkholderia sp. Ac-20379]|uniref:hypothetical protein n=1 Tax=Burkholderia sp. Ac-20379 TaxID=2703900 RepID=UPI00197E43E9|nr:hypothetical protein [Burkholderia sp. Ac-20379]MBN3725764.1 hypothetical protein [Burkholderia sp. Ac-20379]
MGAISSSVASSIVKAFANLTPVSTSSRRGKIAPAPSAESRQRTEAPRSRPIELNAPISDVPALKARLHALFDDPTLAFTDYAHYGVVFDVPGKLKDCKAGLLTRTDASLWDGEAGHWFYRCDTENWLLTLRSVPHAVYCMATVMSLHLQHLERFRVTPERQAEIDADTARTDETPRESE